MAEPGTATGTPGNWWTTFALRPAIFKHCVQGFQVYRTVSLDPVLRELGQTRAGWARGSRFVFSQHCKQMRALGVPEEKIRAIPHWEVSDRFDELASLISEVHSYDTPEIIATPVVAGSMDYLAWITEQTEAGDGDGEAADEGE